MPLSDTKLQQLRERLRRDFDLLKPEMSDQERAALVRKHGRSLGLTQEQVTEAERRLMGPTVAKWVQEWNEDRGYVEPAEPTK